MPSPAVFALGALALAQSASAVLWHGPKQTMMAGKAALDGNGYSPRPTQAPGIHQQHRELFKRAIASPRTCGWLYDASASASSVYACATGTCGYFYTAGASYQGCCAFGYSSCNVPTTCYDYAQYTSSRCTGSCSDNDFNLICTRSAAGKCQTFTYPGRGVKGYGCDTDTESTTTTIFSTFTPAGVVSASALFSASTAFLSSIPAYALTSSTSRLTFGATSTQYSGGSSSSYDSYDNSVGIAVLVPVILVCVAWGLGYVCCIVLLVILCRRHKRNMTTIDQQNAARAAGVGGFANAVPYNGTNVLSPGSHQSTYYGSDPNASTIYGTKSDPSPQMAQGYPAPMQTPPPMAGSPVQTYGTPPAGQAMYGGAPNTNSMYGGFPQPQQMQQQQSVAHEMYSPTPQPPSAATGGSFPLPNQPQAYAYTPPAGQQPPIGSAVTSHSPPAGAAAPTAATTSSHHQGGTVHEM